MAAFSMFTKFAESDRAWHKTAAKEIWFVPLFFWIYRLFQKGFLRRLCALSVLLLYYNSTTTILLQYANNILKKEKPARCKRFTDGGKCPGLNLWPR